MFSWHDGGAAGIDNIFGWGCTPCLHSGHPLPLSAGGVEPLTKFSKRGGGLIGSQLLEGVC